ncbi:MAG: hypothetical protein COT24_01665 [Candidatus Kerfeldbacteria bacterium CG08_land_8_20_14_0_20_40_16]|uniref:WxL domain-containing protein n=1 Tax=Candidatus Kerfeldbacteria bacterium CG08_land_8_20_14_0_20_40_16 TaxID=2014244 RepID=A0A2H0YX05_9BACT|nr:MAG: hypothetical protein COT24_01665 [Candidatus Kerfeldbacteria bacterium CG08_land_8_20_14_0_20_40_16]
METKLRKTKEQIISLIIILVMFTMVFGKLMISNIQDVWADDQANITLEEIITGSDLGTSAPTQVNFAGFTINGFVTNVAATLNDANAWDLRGTGVGWSFTAITNNMIGSGLLAPGNMIANTAINISTAGGITGLGGSSTTGIALGGSIGNFSDGPMTIANASTNNGMGNYVVNSTILQTTIAANNKAGTYQSTLTISIQ